MANDIDIGSLIGGGETNVIFSNQKKLEPQDTSHYENFYFAKNATLVSLPVNFSFAFITAVFAQTTDGNYNLTTNDLLKPQYVSLACFKDDLGHYWTTCSDDQLDEMRAISDTGHRYLTYSINNDKIALRVNYASGISFTPARQIPRNNYCYFAIATYYN